MRQNALFTPGNSGNAENLIIIYTDISHQKTHTHTCVPLYPDSRDREISSRNIPLFIMGVPFLKQRPKKRLEYIKFKCRKTSVILISTTI